MDGKEGPDSKIDRRRIFFFMKKMIDEKDGMKRDTGRVALIPLDRTKIRITLSVRLI